MCRLGESCACGFKIKSEGRMDSHIQEHNERRQKWEKWIVPACINQHANYSRSEGQQTAQRYAVCAESAWRTSEPDYDRWRAQCQSQHQSDCRSQVSCRRIVQTSCTNALTDAAHMAQYSGRQPPSVAQIESSSGPVYQEGCVATVPPTALCALP
jgi:hypothetical protein